MTAHDLRILSGAMMALAAVFMLREALQRRSAGGPWSGQALFGAGFLLMGTNNVVLDVTSTLSAGLAVTGAVMTVVGVLWMRSQLGSDRVG